MTEDEVKTELGIHLTKAVLSQVASTRDTIARTVVTLCTVAIPAHLALLNLFSNRLSSVHLALRVAPVFLWLVALLLTGSILFPRSFQFDFKQPEAIIDANAKRVAYARRVGATAYFLSLVGLVWMAALFLRE